MTNRASLPFFGLPVLALALLAGCTPKEDTNTASGSPTSAPTTNSGGTNTGGTDSKKAVSVAFVTNNSSDYWTLARKGTEKATKEDPGITVEYKLPGQGTAAEQKTILDDLLAKGIQGVAISPVDPTNGTQMLNDAAGKTLLFTQDSDAPNSNRVCYIGSDNTAAGKLAGEEVKRALPNGGTVMVFVGSKDAQNAKERFEGMKSALEGTKVTVLDIRTDDTDRVKAKSNVADALVKYPDLGCCVGLWSYNGPAIYNAVKEGGKVGKVKIVCFDEEKETVAGVKEGAIDATIIQQPYEFGYQSIKTMAAYLRGDKSVVPSDKRIIIPNLAVTKTNIAEFSQKMDKLRNE